MSNPALHSNVPLRGLENQSLRGARSAVKGSLQGWLRFFDAIVAGIQSARRHTAGATW